MRAQGSQRPGWLPVDDTVAPVEAGVDWDAVRMPQELGLAVLSVLDPLTDRRPGPVIWETRRAPRLYFLVPPGSAAGLFGEPAALLGRGHFVAVPGATVVQPPGPHWLVPPDPDAPGGLVDEQLLARVIRQVRGASWVEYEPPGARLRHVLVNSEQLHGRACVECAAAAGVELEPAGQAFIVVGSGRVGYPVVACVGHGPRAAGGR